VPLSFLITAGPTREAIDPVRFISNPSSGRMGYALVEAAAAAGHTVRLVAGPTCLEPPPADEVVRVTSAQQMRDAVLARLDGTDVLVMAAAVADYRPKTVHAQKVKKTPGVLRLELEPTPDILTECAAVKRGRTHVGFAAETTGLVEHARGKLEAKALDLIVANDVTEQDAGFDVETNRATLLWRDGRIEALPVMTKRELAQYLVEAITKHHGC
jgi:phosphopantothenoylcysteine decarboxylase/phosphopantothenate--cysteine ligase